MNAPRSTPTDSQPGGAVEDRASSDARVTYGRLLLTLGATLLLSGVIVAFGNGRGGEPRVDPERAANPTPETVAERSTTSSSTTTSTVEEKTESMDIAECLRTYAGAAKSLGKWYLNATPTPDEASSVEPVWLMSPEVRNACGGGENFRFCGPASGGSLKNKQGAKLNGGIIEFENSRATLRVVDLRDCRSPAPPISQPQVPDSLPTVTSRTRTTTSEAAKTESSAFSTATSSSTTTDHPPDLNSGSFERR